MSRSNHGSAVFERMRLVETDEYPVFRSAIPPLQIEDGRYLLRFAQNSKEVEAALRLRFDVFNLELGEGMDASFHTGLDRDEFDDFCHHLIVLDKAHESIVGTYRMQTSEMAAAGRGFYSSSEFDLSDLPTGVLQHSVELGRACVDKAHRNTQVLFLLWKGLASYVAYNYKRYLFGCCSLTGQIMEDGDRVFEYLTRNGHLHPSLVVCPREGFECRCGTRHSDLSSAPIIPKLFKIYLRFGAAVCGPPAIDRIFKTIDFFVIFDVDQMNERTRRMFFEA